MLNTHSHIKHILIYAHYATYVHYQCLNTTTCFNGWIYALLNVYKLTLQKREKTRIDETNKFYHQRQQSGIKYQILTSNQSSS